MAIDARIALGVQPMQVQMPNPNAGMNALAQAMQIKGSMQQQDVNALQMQEMQRGIEDKNFLRSELAKPDADPYKIMMGRGMLDQANSYRKNQVEADKAAAQAEKDRFDMAHKRIDSWGQAMGFVRQNPTPENAQAAVQHLVNLKVMPPEMAQAAIASVQANPTPQNIAQWAEMGFRTALQAKEQLPKFQTNNIGGSTVTQQIDPVTGRAAVASTIQNTQSPDNAASVAAQMRGQNMVDARARESAAIQRQGLELQREAARMEIKDTAEGLVMIDKGTKQVTPLKDHEGKPLGPKLRDMPAPAQQAMLSNATNMARAERALALVEGRDIGDPAQGGQKGDKAATGLKGYLPNQVLNRVDPQGVDARAAIADLGSLVIHERSGAAVTAAEFPRLAPFIPTEKDDADTVKKKLRRFIQVYKEEMAGMQSVYSRENGYRGNANTGSAAGSVDASDPLGLRKK